MISLMRKVLVIAFLLCDILVYAQSGSHGAEKAAWMNAVTSAEVDLGKKYTDKAIVVHADSEGLKTIDVDNISDFYKNRRWERVESLTSIAAFNAGTHIGYEIITFRANNENYIQLVIWNQKEGKPLRELEVLAKSESEDNVGHEAIDAARDEWIRVCNEHDPLKLVAERYTPDALYYNHKPMVVGTEAIAKEYGYMGNSSYQLNLTPLVTKMATSDLAFEIGQCSGSYQGKYLLVWRKSVKNGWQVAFDSNI